MRHRDGLAERRFDMVRRFESSGLSAKAFAQQEGVSIGTLRNWRKRARSEDQPATFIPVTVVPEADAPSPIRPLARIDIGGLTLEVMPGADAEEVSRLVRALAC